MASPRDVRPMIHISYPAHGDAICHEGISSLTTKAVQPEALSHELRSLKSGVNRIDHMRRLSRKRGQVLHFVHPGDSRRQGEQNVGIPGAIQPQRLIQLQDSSRIIMGRDLAFRRRKGCEYGSSESCGSLGRRL
jgi:hypothetical protein